MEAGLGFKLFGATIIPDVPPEPKPVIQERNPSPIEEAPVKELSPAESSVSATQIPAVIEPWSQFSPEIRDVLRSIGVPTDHEPVHVFTKSLSPSDVNPNLNRLLIPRNLIIGTFLNAREEALLFEKVKLDVTVIDPSLAVRRMLLNRWNYEDKDNKKGKKQSKVRPASSSSSTTTDTTDSRYAYALINTWRTVLDGNGLCDKDSLQGWLFRFNGNSIGLIIIKEIPKVSDGSSSSSALTSWAGKRKRGSRGSSPSVNSVLKIG